MNATMEIEVFRAGDYGPKGKYSPADLAQIAEDYDPAWHEAPVTLDHRQDGPAYGWVESLRAAGDLLIARLKDLHESLREWISKGAYKKRSIELYRSFARTGRPYLRAVSFLGACPPEVKGLSDPIFREDEGERVVVEFDDRPSAGSARAETERFAELESLRSEASRLALELDKERAERRRAEIERFCESARREGRILPAWEANGLVEFMLALGRNESAIPTADGRNLTVLEWFKEFLGSLGPQIDLREIAPSRGEGGDLRRPAIPRPSERATIRPESLALHEKAVAYCREHEGTSYVEALQAVARF